MEYYVISSLEIHLFFARIMKEHALFLEVGFTQANCDCKAEARFFREAFEDLLNQVVCCSEGIVGPCIFESGEVVTDYTLCSELQTAKLTGTCINTNITKRQLEFLNSCMNQQQRCIDRSLVNAVRQINCRSLELLQGLICLKERVLNSVLNCCMFTMNYPLLIEHILREAKLYEKYIMYLESGNECDLEDLKDDELFWNQIMMEHALFIRGLLDPTENDLIMQADDFASVYADLLDEASTMTERTMGDLTCRTLEETIKYRDFKLAGTKGINDCEIRSIILPLLADHVLREANHYIRILEQDVCH
ncbi:DUF2935 domain-containing protein [Lachnoclostridium phytofermentans]|uniref:DUF2935 domain-containing protein n=1 Tax=Lachnoclostridium phytofermentans (strain ATCC 700394 / DSM 18823 / ISDg) TaxID=357809 RepID=A9KM06_LACP7|nr:DUF2935 domain-containing protein [Lachnoclostridium phytofermentans]ABX41349.1 conserved hypothetical protein [Lachnoclostridium phytofermentans ISDg]